MSGDYHKLAIFKIDVRLLKIETFFQTGERNKIDTKEERFDFF